MNKKPIYWATGILMALCFCFSMYSRYELNTMAPENYTITLTTLLDVFAAQPLLYMGLGLICALRLFSAIEGDGLRLAALIGSIVMIVFFAVIAALSIAQVDFTIGFFAAFRYLFKTPAFFLVPGILLGLGLKTE